MAEHFKVTLETGKKRSRRRILYVKTGRDEGADGIMHAYTVGKKIRGATIMCVIPITFDQYMKGVDQKYSPDHPEVY